MTLRPELQAVLDHLLQAHAQTVTLDRLGERIGSMAVSTDEIDAMIATLEARGRTVTAPPGGEGERHLAQVLAAARTFGQAHGRRPKTQEIAASTGLSEAQVRQALMLTRIMQR